MRLIFMLCVYVRTYPVNPYQNNNQYGQGNGSHLIYFDLTVRKSRFTAIEISKITIGESRQTYTQN